MGGLISEKYLGVPCPSTAVPDPALPCVAHAVDYIDAYGGWTKTQGLLKAVKSVADKHSVTMKTVAMRWAIDQHTVPSMPIQWHKGTNQAIDDRLTDKPSFFDDADINTLSSVART